jgi:hypothetical protein
MSRETFRTVSIVWFAGMVPTSAPDDGRVFQVTVDSDHVAGLLRNTDSTSTDPAVAEVVVRITRVADCSTSPAGAGGRVNLRNAHSWDDE